VGVVAVERLTRPDREFEPCLLDRVRAAGFPYQPHYSERISIDRATNPVPESVIPLTFHGAIFSLNCDKKISA
jgi:hypothetical protein